MEKFLAASWRAWPIRQPRRGSFCTGRNVFLRPNFVLEIDVISCGCGEKSNGLAGTRPKYPDTFELFGVFRQL